MPPAVASALITAGMGLVGGLMGQSAAREEKRKDRLAQAEQEGFKTEALGGQQLAHGQQSAFESLMGSYGKAFS